MLDKNQPQGISIPSWQTGLDRARHGHREIPAQRWVSWQQLLRAVVSSTALELSDVMVSFTVSL
jgi:hypothetical protein